MISREELAYMAVARAIATMADCTHRNVGAVVVSEGKIVGHGFNKGADRHPTCNRGGCPRGKLPRGEGKQDYSDCIAVHAEILAIFMAGQSLCEGGVLYVNSEPCFMCYRVAEVAGIVRVIWQTTDESSMYERQLGRH